MRRTLWACQLMVFSGLLAGQSNVPGPIFRITGGVRPPRPILTPQPEPPKDANGQKTKFKGTVVLSGYVGTDGKYHVAKVTRSINEQLDAAAIEGVKNWKFSPCTRDGTPVNCYMDLQIDFHLY